MTEDKLAYSIAQLESELAVARATLRAFEYHLNRLKADLTAIQDTKIVHVRNSDETTPA